MYATNLLNTAPSKTHIYGFVIRGSKIQISYYDRAEAIKSPMIDLEDKVRLKNFIWTIVLLTDELHNQICQIAQLCFREKGKVIGL